MFCCINPHSTQTCTRACTTHSHTQLAAVCKNSLSTPLKLTDRCWTFHRLNYMDLWLSNTHTHTPSQTHTHPLRHTHTPTHTHPHTHAAGLLCGLTSPDLQTPPALSPAWNTEKKSTSSSSPHFFPRSKNPGHERWSHHFELSVCRKLWQAMVRTRWSVDY